MANSLLQKNNGDKVGTRVEYAIDLSVDGGPYETVVNGAVDDKTTSLYERSHRVNLPKSLDWMAVAGSQNHAGFHEREYRRHHVVAVTEIIDAKLRYVNTALLYVEFDAKQFLMAFLRLCAIRKGESSVYLILMIPKPAPILVHGRAYLNGRGRITLPGFITTSF